MKDARDVVEVAVVFGVIFGITGLLAAIAHDAPTEPAEPDAVVLSKGDDAPFDGILLPPGRAANLGTKLELCEAKRSVDKQLFDSELKIRVDSMQSVVSIEREAATSQRTILEKKLEAAEAREWWEQPTVLITAGAVGGIAATVGGVFLLGALRPLVPAPTSTP